MARASGSDGGNAFKVSVDFLRQSESPVDLRQRQPGRPVAWVGLQVSFQDWSNLVRVPWRDADQAPESHLTERHRNEFGNRFELGGQLAPPSLHAVQINEPSAGWDQAGVDREGRAREDSLRRVSPLAAQLELSLPEPGLRRHRVIVGHPGKVVQGFARPAGCRREPGED